MTTPERPSTILIVEDNADLLHLLVNSLQRIGHFTVVGALDGVVGLEKFYEIHPDCVVIDVKMPGLNGIQLVRAIRGDPATAMTPLIILTAMAQDKDQFAGLAAGADQYLLKPATPQELMVVIQRAIQLSTLEREEQLRKLAEDQPESS